MSQGLRGRAHRGRLEDLENNEGIRTPLEFATLQPLGNSRIGLDVVNVGVHYVSQSQNPEAGSTRRKIVLTGHSARRGDLIRITSSANGILEYEIAIDSVTANEIILVGDVSAEFDTSDTIDILRPVTFRMTTGGGLTTGPVSFNLDGSETEVTEDTVDPANNTPLPVKLTGVTGDISITSNDLNVQLSHLGASHDSVRLGNGVNLVDINASNEMQVRDDDANTALGTLNTNVAKESTLAAQSAKLPATLGQKTMAASMAVTLASDQSALDINNVSGTVSLPTGASTEAKQDDVITALGTSNTNTGNTATSVSNINSKLGSLGQKASAGSAPMVLSTEQEAILDAVKTSVELLDNAVSGNELQIDIVSAGPAALETTQAAMSAKLPASLGQKTSANSMSVTLASDQSKLNTSLEVVDFLDAGVLDASSTAINTGGSANLVTLAADVKKIQIFEDIGEFMSLRTSAGAVLAYLPLGGGEIDVAIPSSTILKLYSETGSNITAGKIAMNFLG